MKSKLLILLAACAPLAQAQDLTTEITVDRTVTVDLPAADPLPSVTPSLREMPAPAVSLRPTQYTSASAFAPSVFNPGMPAYTSLALPSNYRGYAWAGYFPAVARTLGAGYRFLRKSATTAGIAARYNGDNWNGIREGERRNSLNIIGVEGDFCHSFSEMAQVSVSADYTWSRVGSERDKYMAKELNPQMLNNFDLKAGVSGDNGRFDYAVKLKYYLFSASNSQYYNGFLAFPQVSDHGVDLGVDFGIDLGRNSRFDIALGADFLQARGAYLVPGWPDATITAAPHDTQGLYTVNPAFSIAYGKIRARVGLIANAGSNSPRSTFHVAPDIKVSWIPSGHFAFYALARGGENYFTLADQYAISPFLPGISASGRSFTPADITAGFNLRVAGNFTADIFASHSSVRGLQALSFVRSRQPSGEREYTSMNAVNANAFYGGIRLGYTLGRILDVKASATFYQSGYNHVVAENPYRAKGIVTASVTSHVTEKLDVTADYKLRYGQRVYGLPSEMTALPNLSDLSLHATYALSDRLGLFLSIDNLLCRRTMLVPDICSRRLGGMAGVTCRF